jgi:hypothetical protein
MKKNTKCTNCNNWTIEKRQKTLCWRCNNSMFVQNPKTIKCNMCNTLMCQNEYPYGLYKTIVSGGCFSKHLTDMVSYEFNLCEECLRKMFNNFINPPTTYNSPSYKEDKKEYEYKIWRETDAFNKAYLNRKCNNAKNCSNNAIYFINEKYNKNHCCCEKHLPEANNPNYVLTNFVPEELKIFK